MIFCRDEIVLECRYNSIMESVTQALVEDILLASIRQCAEDGDFELAAGRVRGDLELLNLGLDSVNVVSLMVVIQQRFAERTGQQLGDEELQDFLQGISVKNTVSAAAGRLFELLHPGA